MRPSVLPISIIVLLAAFFSCTIEKRVHRPGYHIEWKKSRQHNSEVSETKAAREFPALHDPGSETEIVRPEILVKSEVPDPMIAPIADPERHMNKSSVQTDGRRIVFPKETLRKPARKAVSIHENSERDWVEMLAIIAVSVLIIAMTATAIWMFYAFFNPWGAYVLLGLALILLFLLFYSGGLSW